MSYQLRLRNKSKIWTCRIKLKSLGAPVEFSTRTTDKAKANKIASDRHETYVKQGAIKTSWKGNPNLTCKIMRDWDCIRAANETSNWDYATNRVPKYWDAIESFFSSFSDIDAENLQAYVSHRKGPDKQNPRIQNQSIKQELYCLKRGLKFARGKGYMVSIPEIWPKLPIVSGEDKAGRYYTREKILAFFSALKDHPKRGSLLGYQYAIFVLGTGFRYGELSRLRLLKLKRSQLKGSPTPWLLEIPAGVRKVKNRPHILVLTDTVASALRALPPTFRDYRTAWRNASKRAGLDYPMHARSLRHAFASAAAGCMDAKAVDIAMNHKKGMDMIYQHGDEIRMQRVMVAVTEAFPVLGPLGGNLGGRG